MSDKTIYAVDLKTDDLKNKSGIVLVRATTKGAALHHLATARKATVADLEKIGTANIIEASE